MSAKNYLTKNVYEASKERISWTFDNFEKSVGKRIFMI